MKLLVRACIEAVLPLGIYLISLAELGAFTMAKSKKGSKRKQWRDRANEKRTPYGIDI
jgi:hypothetical protein